MWHACDQTSNTKEGPIANARAEGVADRVRVETADMRELPYADGAFDVVVSSWAVHNLEELSDRKRALAEMVRVLRRGGWLLLNDIANRHDYQSELGRLGLGEVRLVITS